MRVVSNTSPISNLAIIDRLGLLSARYHRVLVPSAVASELAALSHPLGKQRIAAAIANGWLSVDASADVMVPSLRFPLDPGETSAIALALHIKADILLMDERRGREAARRFGLVVAGALGELAHAKLVGRIANVRDEIKRLRQEAGFFVDPKIERFILAQVGEA
jgi:hypothetical protein